MAHPCLSFHAYKSVAPLKLVRPRELDATVPGFHAYKSVAPLKRASASRDVQGGSEKFPRLQKRGPIEASSPSRSASSATRFPRLQKRGPIEAGQGAQACTGTSWFPRLQKRGPIEALLRLASGVRMRRFHAYKSVAPLKRCLGPRRG